MERAKGKTEERKAKKKKVEKNKIVIVPHLWNCQQRVKNVDVFSILDIS